MRKTAILGGPKPFSLGVHMIFVTEGFTIRKIYENDVDTIFRVYKDSEDFLLLGPEPKASKDMVFKDIESSAKTGGIYCLILNKEEEEIGIVDFIPNMYKENPRYGYISLIMIKSEYRNKGYGKKVVDLIEGIMQKQHQVEKVFVSIQENNAKGIKFWERKGYKIFSEPELQPDKTIVLHMEKDLSKYEE